MKITVLGAGAWGTALALAALRAPGCAAPAHALVPASAAVAPAHRVRLWARDPAQTAAMQAARCNARYLPGFDLPPQLELLAAPAAALPALCQGEDLIIVGTPMAALRPMLLALRSVDAPLVWLCKGFEQVQAPALVGTDSAAAGTVPAADLAHAPPVGLLGHEIAAALAPQLRVGVLSGPSFAREVAAAAPTALVAASVDASVTAALVQALHGPSLRIYASDDVVGVEVGGAVKNVLAIAAGLCDGLQLGHNARAALITRGLAETVRLGLALGARAETFMGLSGLGDLVLTATGDLSRNRQVGLRLAQGQGLAQALAALGHVAEGVYSARTVVQRAQALGVAMPIAQAVLALLDGHWQPAQALAELMGREPALERR